MIIRIERTHLAKLLAEQISTLEQAAVRHDATSIEIDRDEYHRQVFAVPQSAIGRARRGETITAAEWDTLPAWMRNRIKRPASEETPGMLVVADLRRPICQRCDRFRGLAGRLSVHCGCKGLSNCSNVVNLNGACPETRWGTQLPPEISFASNVGRSPAVATAPADVVSFPVDLVVIWVDGADPAWQAQFNKFVKGGAGSRFTDAGELRFLLRSVKRFAPWIRRVYIVTADQRPTLEATGLDVRIISHREIIPEKYLPTFCSSTIEAGVHNIPDLAEHFLFANDDTMFGAPVEPGHFFTADGKAKLTFGGIMRKTGGVLAMRNNGADALDSLFGVHQWRNTWHHIAPCRRSALAELAGRLPEKFDEWMSQRTRTGKSVALNNALWPEYMLNAGYGVEVGREAKLRSAYIGAADLGDRARANAIISAMPHLICINNSVAGDVQKVTSFGEAYWPAADRQSPHPAIVAIRSDVKPRIPQIIHFVWIGGPMPEWAERNISTAKELHPGWEVMVHTSIEEMPADLQAAARACGMYCVISDIMRFWALERWGGIYLDADVTLYRSLEPLRKLPVFASESYDSRPYCAVMGSAPEDPVIKRLVGTVRRIHAAHGRPTSRISYGPDNVQAERRSLLLLPRHLFYAYRSPAQCLAAYADRAGELARMPSHPWPHSEQPFGLHVFGVEVPGKGRSSFAKVAAPDIHSLELEITYECGMACYGCNRVTGLVPGSPAERLSARAIDAMLRESERIGHQWWRLSLCGGEPTTHPEFREIADVLDAYRIRQGGHVLIQLATHGNGVAKRHVEAIKKSRPHWIILNSNKTGRSNAGFVSMTVAGRDVGLGSCGYAGCGIPRNCGVAMNFRGFYVCAMAAAIDRVFGLGIAVDLGSLDAGRLTSTFDAVCSRCGHYTNMPAGGRDAVSSSWKDAILSRRNGHGGGSDVVVANGVFHAEGENAIAVGDQIGLPANSDGLRIT